MSLLLLANFNSKKKIPDCLVFISILLCIIHIALKFEGGANYHLWGRFQMITTRFWRFIILRSFQYITNHSDSCSVVFRTVFQCVQGWIQNTLYIFGLYDEGKHSSLFFCHAVIVTIILCETVRRRRFHYGEKMIVIINEVLFILTKT